MQLARDKAVKEALENGAIDHSDDVGIQKIRKSIPQVH
jgi:hypothetical protein